MKKLLLLCFALAATLELAAADKRVLVYTRNYTKDGKGYVHDNIATSIEMIRKLGRENGFTVDASDKPSVFTEENLKQYQALVFSNSNNEAFENEEQRAVFKRFVQRGGGFVGIHSASGSERNWPYFWAVLGAKFRRHPPLQPFTIQVLDQKHPSAAHLGATWQWADEFYYTDNMNPRMHVILAGEYGPLKDPKATETDPGKQFGGIFPLAWCQEYDGGREFYTALGHKIEYYSDPNFQKHVLGGILWVMRMKN
ncbi:MAG: ThuA domain-containing protein [Verrucomicrobia bacterium]|nr:ThuA domain-containing protein [Verrucomicrobiota bacterium]